MEIQINDVGPKISETDVNLFEKRMGFSFPKLYRKFLIKFNGGKPNPYFFIIPRWIYQISIVNEFNGIIPGRYNDLEENIELLEDRLPKGFIPIADDPGGNSILISLKGSNRGKIYFWDHENEPEDYSDSVEDYPNIYFLANNIEEFLNSLKDKDKLKHPTLEIHEGDSLDSVRSLLELTEPPEIISDVDEPKYMNHIEELGFWVFFDSSKKVYSIRFESPYPFAVDGVHIGDTENEVLETRGKPDRYFPVKDGIKRWIYDKPYFLRIDFDPETNTVKMIFR